MTALDDPAAHLDAASVDRWLADLRLPVSARAERDGAVSWDLELDGRVRAGLRITLILQPGLGLVLWLPYAPALTDGLRKSYQQLLQWNDELPFVKFGLDPELRPVLSAELPVRLADADLLGLAIARIVAVCDRLLPASAGWLPEGARTTADDRESAGSRLLGRYAADLAELLEPASPAPADTAG